MTAAADALTSGPIYYACVLLLAGTVLLDLVLLVGAPARRRPCCETREDWRTLPDRLNGWLLPARLVAWGYIAGGDVLHLATGTGDWWDPPLDLFVIAMLALEYRHRRSHRRGRRRQRSAARVVVRGHRLAVEPTS